MKISDRITWIVIGLICAYFAVVAGDAIHQWVAADTSVPKGGNALFASALSILILLVAGASITAIYAIQHDAVISAIILAVSAFFFGEFVGPITAYGPYPWQWRSGWNILLVLGAIPMTFVVKDVASDVIAARRQAKQGKSNIVPLKREDRA